MIPVTIDAIRVTEVLKVDDDLGIIYGFGIVCSLLKDGSLVEYYDLQEDHIPEVEMVKALAAFMATKEQVGKVQHTGEQQGDILFAFPMTQAVAKGLWPDVALTKFGALIAFKPYDRSLLDATRKGEFTGFSLGGSASRDVGAAR